MRRLAVAAASLFFVALSANAQGKERDIRRAIELSRSAQIAVEMLDTLLARFAVAVPGEPEGYWEKYRDPVLVEELVASLVDLMVPLYDKYYTHDDIRQLIAFYDSPIGRKMIEVTPLMTRESLEVGELWGEELTMRIMDQLVVDGYVTR